MEKKKRNILIAIGLAIIIVTIIILVSLLTRKHNTYTINFNTNGGNEIKTVIVDEKGKIKEPKAPTKEGYVFAGWYLNDKLFDFNTEINENMTLEARWEAQGDFKLNVDSLTLVVGEDAVLEASFTDELTWKSSNESVVTVTKDGKVKAIKEGSAIITVTNKDRKSVTCKITVKEKSKDIIEVSKVTIDGKKEVTVGSTIKLTASISPKDATNQEITWKSSNTKYATIDKNGNVKGIKEGTVTITATSSNGKTASFKVTIKAKTSTNNNNNNNTNTNTNKPSTGTGSTTTPDTPKTIPVSDVTLSGATSVNVNSTISLTVTINPSNATNKKYTCTGDNANVATVSPDCKVTGKNDGDVTITVTTADGQHKATHKVTVNSTYKIIFTKIYNDNNLLTRYDVVVYRNNVTWKDYKSILYRGEYQTFANGRALVDDVDEGVSKATIYLNNGKTANAQVIYN